MPAVEEREMHELSSLKTGSRNIYVIRSEENARTARPVLVALILPVFVRVAIHQLTGDRITFLPEPPGTVHGVWMVCRQ